MENFEKQPGMNYPKIKPIWIVSFLLAVCVIFLGYEFGWKKIESSIEQRGIIKGQIQVLNWELRELQTQGRFYLTFQDAEKGTTTIMLLPFDPAFDPDNNSTTTK